jgi:glycine/D-amino acid oxidase-like deaminating enzyme
MQKVDVTIIGSGAMALWLSWTLVCKGFAVAVIEIQRDLAGGASSKNEGWLHRGTYHSVAITDRNIAIQVARRTIAGHDMTLQFAPEARTELGSHTFALLRSEAVEETTSRWAEAGVFHRLVSKREVRRLEPDLNFGKYDCTFEVADVAIDSRIVYRKLADEIRAKGGVIFTGMECVGLCGHAMKLRKWNGCEQHLETKVLVCAAGCGIRPFFKSVIGIDLPMRYFVSHLFDVPRIARHAFFGVDPSDITAMHHGEWSIVGFTKDQVPVPAPSFEPGKDQIEQIKAALQEVASKADVSRGTGRACTKVDVDYATSSTKSFGNLNIAYDEPIQNIFWVLPGKMTEAPYAARQLGEVLCTRVTRSIDAKPLTNPVFGLPQIAMRPIDLY